MCKTHGEIKAKSGKIISTGCCCFPREFAKAERLPGGQSPAPAAHRRTLLPGRVGPAGGVALARRLTDHRRKEGHSGGRSGGDPDWGSSAIYSPEMGRSSQRYMGLVTGQTEDGACPVTWVTRHRDGSSRNNVQAYDGALR